MSASGQMTIRFWGVRGSIPSPAATHLRYGGNTSCVEVRCDDQLLILDGGSGLRLLGQHLMAQPNEPGVRASILLSHTHWDHIQGVPFFEPAYIAGNRITINAAPGRGAQVQRALENQMEPMHFPVRLHDLRGLPPVQELPTDGARIGSIEISTIDLNHPGGCAGFRLRAHDSTIAYIPDHEPYRRDALGNFPAARQELVEFLGAADVLILDTQYTVEQYEKRIGWGHGCLLDSVQLALDANVHRLVLFHHDPSHTDADIDRMIETARTCATGSDLVIEAAAENQSLVVTHCAARGVRGDGSASLPCPPTPFTSVRSTIAPSRPPIFYAT